MNLTFDAVLRQKDMCMVESRLSQLATLLPDMANKLERMRVDILYSLLQDLEGVSSKLLLLRELMPGVNVSQFVTKWPSIVLECDEDTITRRFQLMREQLPGLRVERLLEEEPLLFKADIPLLLSNIKRVLPHANPLQILASQPQMVLDMASAGLDSALDVEGFGNHAEHKQD
ncbi:hypothetical protein CEUSTIGMA_g12864.t1 [Chlamydomonas eustigma]|uniref:Uncharacterized protein n=1 Tax=Chlamydomonas eustigma TaxID=1157962 RepID=A0A250XQW0_9CHLO|nr:hypothetical protein CEUSTIGMA_g12864.t1 [Chlamydomonas eustigma]|eukprot:GAX85448.1 hypothetical protein CEUSTIGMA_g12864.t1 [Chlamydomonas eustigma]